MKRLFTSLLLVLALALHGANISPVVDRTTGLLVAPTNFFSGNTGGLMAALSPHLPPPQVIGGGSVRPSVWLDSVAGSDTSTGTNSFSAWKSIAKFTNTYGHAASGMDIYLARGSHWREILRLGSNNVVQAYGSGARPILDASDVFTNSWVADTSGGKTKTYAVTNVTMTDGGNPQQINVYENGVPLWRSNTLAGVDAVAGTYSAPIDMPAGSATNIVYIHSLNDGAPGLVEIAKRSHGLIATHNNRIIGIHTRNNAHNDGSLVLGLDNWVEDCVAENGSKHNMLIASGHVQDTLLLNASYQSSSAYLVIYNSADGLSFSARNVRAYQDPRRPCSLSSAYLSHTASQGYKYFYLEDVTAENVDNFGSFGVHPSYGVGIWNRVGGLGLTTGGFFARYGTNIFIDPWLIDTPNRRLGNSARSFDVGGQIWITGARVARQAGGTEVYAAMGDSEVNIHQSVFYRADPTVTANLFSAAINSNNVYFTVSNTIAQGHTYPYLCYTNTGVRAAGSNVFKVHGSMAIGGTNFANWGSYRAAFGGGLDVGSVTNEVLFTGDVLAGDYRFGNNSYAATNQAGPGWDPSRLPDWFSLKGVPVAKAERPTTLPTYNPAVTSTLQFGPDISFDRISAGLLAMRSNGVPQGLNIYRYSTNGNVDSEYGFLSWFSTEFMVGLNKSGNGANRSLGLAISGSTRWRVGTDSSFAPTANYALGTAALPVGHVTSSGTATVSNLVVTSSSTADSVLGIGTTNPATSLHITAGGMAARAQTFTANTMLGYSNSVAFFNTSGGALTCRLTNSAPDGLILWIKNLGANPLTIQTTGGETIDGSSSLSLSSQYDKRTLIRSGSTWTSF